MDPEQPTQVHLTRAEALVLFEWLHRLEEDRRVVTEDRAEQIALGALSSALERCLLEPFQLDYRQLVDQARHHLTAET